MIGQFAPVATGALSQASGLVGAALHQATSLASFDSFSLVVEPAAKFVAQAPSAVASLFGGVGAVLPQATPHAAASVTAALPAFVSGPASMMGFIDPISIAVMVAGAAALAGGGAYVFSPRLRNLMKGWFSSKISGVEANNPAAVYQSAIDERIKKAVQLKKAVSGIVYLRQKLESDLEKKKAQLTEVEAMLQTALSTNEDAAAITLLEQKNELEPAITALTAEHAKVSQQAEEAKEGLVTFQAEIEKLRREMTEMLAKAATAEARIQIQETLNGLSASADIRALDTVRESINKLQAEADMGAELQNADISTKLKQIKQKTGNAQAQAQLAELKRQQAAAQAAKEGQVVQGGGGAGGKNI